MSILSNSGLGAEMVLFNTLYKRRDEFMEKYINSINTFWGSMEGRADFITVYTMEEYRFLNEYIKKFGCSDKKFSSAIEILCTSPAYEEFDVYVPESENKDASERQTVSKYQQKQYRMHGGRKPAKFF